MIPYKLIGRKPLAESLAADDIEEFHAARLLLLIARCGRGHIEGLTKMAKLDFFVRYPDFFKAIVNVQKVRMRGTESRMIRYHYGPWDDRYHNVLAFLTSRNLITVDKSGKATMLKLTAKGNDVASRIGRAPEYADLVAHMDDVGNQLGSKSGNMLKKMIYEEFEAEIADLALGELIE